MIRIKNLTRNQIITIVISVLIVILLTISVAISIRLQNANQAPVDSSADCYSACIPECEAGAAAGERANDPAAQAAWRAGCPAGCRNKCQEQTNASESKTSSTGETVFCNTPAHAGRILTDGAGTNWICLSGDGWTVNNSVDNSCTVVNEGGIGGCIRVNGTRSGQTTCSNAINIYRFTRAMTGPTDECFTSENQFLNWPNATPGRYCPADIVTSCQCLQIDYSTPNGNIIGVKAGKWDASCDPAPVCGDPDFVPGVGQCSPRNTATCNANCQPIGVPVCGDPNFVPGVGQCSPRNTATCNANCQPITPTASCGQGCNATTNCTGGSTCDLTKGVCVIPSCVGRSDCTNNGCRLPETALFGDGPDTVLIGVLLILVGLFINYKNPREILFFVQGKISDASINRKRNNLNKKKKKFQDKIETLIEEKIKRA